MDEVGAIQRALLPALPLAKRTYWICRRLAKTPMPQMRKRTKAGNMTKDRVSKPKQYFRLLTPDHGMADELSLALLHSGFHVHIETERTQFGEMPLWVCIEGGVNINIKEPL